MDKEFQLAKEIAELQYEDISSTDVVRTKLLLLDTIGVAISGSNAPGSSNLMNLFRKWTGGACRVMVFGLKLSPPDAAFFNSFLVHSRDFDDTHDATNVHTCASVVPAVFSASETKKKTDGKTLILSVCIGVDLICKMALAIPLREGWHFSAVFGGLAAAASAGKLLGLTQKELVNAFGFAYSQLSGNYQCLVDRALAKRMQPGFSARNGIFSALMGKEMDCSVNIFEGKHGISNLYGKKNKHSYDIDLAITPVTQIQRVSIKPYPCCRLIHPCIDGMLTLKNRHKFHIEDVEEVRIYVGKRTHQLVGHPFSLGDTPQVNAQFSIPYACSVALINEKVILKDFEENIILKNRKVLEFTKKVRSVINQELQNQESTVPVRVEIKIKNGNLYETTVFEMIGSPDCPLSEEEIRRKFAECVSHSEKRKLIRNISLIEDTILNLERVRDFSSVLDLLIEKE